MFALARPFHRCIIWVFNIFQKSDADTVASFFMEQIILRHGCPKEVVSDRGSVFIGEVFKNIMQKMGVTHRTTTAYRPQSNGIVERTHSRINEAISMYCGTNQKDWDLFIHHIIFAHNTSVHATTKQSPFYLVYGREAVLPAESMLPYLDGNLTLEKTIEKLQKARLITKNKLRKNR